MPRCSARIRAEVLGASLASCVERPDDANDYPARAVNASQAVNGLVVLVKRRLARAVSNGGIWSIHGTTDDCVTTIRLGEDGAASAESATVRSVRDRLALLGDASGPLFASLTVDAVSRALGDWPAARFPPTRTRCGFWMGIAPLARSLAASTVAEFVGEIADWRGTPGSSVPFDTPLPMTDLAAVPLVADRQAAYAAEKSSRCSRFRCGSRTATPAPSSPTFAGRTEFTPDDLPDATALGSLALRR